MTAQPKPAVPRPAVHRPAPAAETKFAGAALVAVEADGTFEGYASLFGRVDLGRDRVLPGAFAASLARRGAGGVRMLWQHDPAQPIGAWLEVREDARGLHVRGRLELAVARAREALALMRRGALDGLSIGFRTARARTDRKTGVRDLVEVDLWEISLVTFPMLPEARVARVKAARAPASPVTQALRPGAVAARRSLLQLDAAASRLRRALQEAEGAKYNPSQPRVPAGDADGGQWTDGGGGGQTSRKPVSGRTSALTSPAADSSGSRDRPSSIDPQTGAERESVGTLRNLHRDPFSQADFGGTAEGNSIAVNPLTLLLGASVLGALALYSILSNRAEPDQRAVVAFTARDYSVNAGGKIEAESAQIVDEETARNICPRLPEVQARTDTAVASVRSSGATYSPQQFGTAVHMNLKDQITALQDPNFVAETSFLRENSNGNGRVRYGLLDTIRLDLLEKTDENTVCVYDIKTGVSGLTERRFREIMTSINRRWPHILHIIIIEVRPTS